ncbi:MAG TPA: hypothetical protein VGM97_04570 [Steroidobacteraceae bacterium]|jgi:hypothetical protein
MNETDFIRQQLAAERAHLREILLAVRGHSALKPTRPISAYVEWASRRLVDQLQAHRTALQAVPTIAAATRAQLNAVGTAAIEAAEAAPARSFNVHDTRLLALLEAWSDSLDAVAGATLRIGHWRQAAHLSADSILEERQLYAAARGAVGLP